MMRGMILRWREAPAAVAEPPVRATERVPVRSLDEDNPRIPEHGFSFGGYVDQGREASGGHEGR